MKKSSIASLTLLICLFIFTGFVITQTPANSDTFRIQKTSLLGLNNFRASENADILIKRSQTPYLIYNYKDRDSVAFKEGDLVLGKAETIQAEDYNHCYGCQYILGLPNLTFLRVGHGQYVLDSFSSKDLRMDMASGTVAFFNCDIETLNIPSGLGGSLELIDSSKIKCLRIPYYRWRFKLQIETGSQIDSLIFDQMDLDNIELEASADVWSKIKYWRVKDKTIIGGSGQ